MANIRFASLTAAGNESELQEQLNEQELVQRREVLGVGLDDTLNVNFVEFKSRLSANKLERLHVKKVPNEARGNTMAYREFIAPLLAEAELLERAIVQLSGEEVEVVILRALHSDVPLPAPRLPTLLPNQTLIPAELLDHCSMKRVVCHWTVGNYEANAVDLNAYHILIEGDGTVRGGTHKISDNVNTGDGRYAAHTKGMNTASIGVSCCCMVGCNESPFRAGPKPMTQSQWEIMVRVVAELCLFYDIKVTPETVLGHGEVEGTLGIKQSGKWDPMVWPWDTSRTRSQVGAGLREMVSASLKVLREADPA